MFIIERDASETKHRFFLNRCFFLLIFQIRITTFSNYTKEKNMRLALFQPDIPQNTGTLLRLGACLDVELDIIEPCGFVFSEHNLKRAGMDYLNLVKYRRHKSWEHFLEYRSQHPEEFIHRPIQITS